MDPVATWKEICEEMKDPDNWEDVTSHLDDLCGWLERGGYRPNGIPAPDKLRGFQRVLEAIQKQNNYHVNPDMYN